MKQQNLDAAKKDCAERVRRIRKSTGMNRMEFCTYFNIPYRTVSDWEGGLRHAPDYVLRLLEYYIRMEGLDKDEREDQ